MADKGAGTAKPWLKLLGDAEERDYHSICDKIDDLYASLRKLSGNRSDRQYQIFWANLEVLRPSIYSRPPVPVATSRFRDRKPLPRKAADVLERVLSADVENDDLHDTLKLCRDDLAASARGVPWLRMIDRDGLEVPSADHVCRKDWRCDPARKWREVGWVARRGWKTRREVKDWAERLKESGYEVNPAMSAPDLGGMVFSERPEDKNKSQSDRGPEKAAIWEIWHKPTRKCVWVCEGVEDVLAEGQPPLDLTGFFPCPRPAYATLQRDTLTPVPDFVYYKDQVEEIHELTARIGGLQQALRVKGFYAAGNGEVADAIEGAMKRVDNRALLVPISSFAALGSGGLSDAIVWWPIDQVVATLQACIEVRRQLVQDVYEITGISDIMRGSTDANETLGAQELKSQYGSIRIQERQGEMVRLARDIIRMKAEIFCENVPIEQLLTMAQVDDIPTQADIQQQLQQLQAQAWQAASQLDPNDPEAQQQLEQGAQQLQAQMAELQQTVTVEQIGALLKDQKLRPFVLDIETDSTIQPDETREKQKRVEFSGALAPVLQQGIGAMQMAPELGPFVAESLRYMASAFRPGRQMDEAIDELAEKFANYQPPPQQQGEDPQAAQAQAQAAMVKAQADAQKAQTDAQVAQQDVQIRAQEADLKRVETEAKVELTHAQTQKVMAEIAMTQREAQVEEAAARQDMVLKARGEQRTDEQHRFAGQQQRAAEKRAGAESAAKVQAMRKKV